MATYYGGIYKTNYVRPKIQVAKVSPMRLEFFSGPKEFVVAGSTKHQVLEYGVSGLPILTATRVLSLPAGNYFVLACRSPESISHKNSSSMELDRSIATISMILDPNIFSECVYRGSIANEFGGGILASTTVMFRHPLTVDETFQKQWHALTWQQPTTQEFRDKFHLMGNYLGRAMTSEPGAERFLQLWTILEIWPMAGSADIRPISETLARHIGLTAHEIKAMLRIGRLCDARSKLLHDGIMPLKGNPLFNALQLLEAICLEVIRVISGMPYAGNLDRYLTEAAIRDVHFETTIAS